jgi:hypothetical protein
MPRLRVSGQVVRSDSTYLNVIKEFSTFGDYENWSDKIVSVPGNTTVAVDLDDMSEVIFLMIISASSIDVTLNGSNQNLQVDNLLMLNESSVTSISLVNATGAEIDVRLIMAG